MNRIIALFDILGFRQFVRQTPLQQVVSSFDRIFHSFFAACIRREVSKVQSTKHLQSVIDTCARIPDSNLLEMKAEFEALTGFKMLLMSDTIVLYSQPFDHYSDALRQVFSTSIRLSRVFLVCLFEGMRHARGAIAMGEFHAGTDKSIYCGKALVEACDVAESQDWIGAVLCPSLDEIAVGYQAKFSVEDYLRDHSIARPEWDFVRYDVPFKTGSRSAWAVNWGSAFNYGGPMNPDFFRRVLTGDTSIDRKYENTLRFLKTWHQEERP